MADALGIAPRGRAPHLGEHTRQVLEGDLGLAAAQVDALAAARVIR
jgi:crotonobetainyl-CoA:carnitine CoA-transferase CaiB-like acyl-CoA transferase